MRASNWIGFVTAPRARLAGVSLLAALALASIAPAAHAQAPVQPYGTDNYGTFYNILPPGEAGLDNDAQLAQFEATGARPAHFSDQVGMYSSLIDHLPITQQQIPNFYKDATFGVPTGDVGSTESPETGVTIVRDSKFDVPHIYGQTRAELMFGIGYATAEDRLFFIDVLRHYGAGDLAAFAGGSNASMDAGQFLIAPYTQQDLQNQVNFIQNHLPDGQQIYQDASNYVDGINAYIDMAKLNPDLMPGEYAALGMPQGPAPFQLTDLIRIASLVGGIFGQGGGNELPNAMLEEGLAAKFGNETLPVAGSPMAPGASLPVASAASVRETRLETARPTAKHKAKSRKRARKVRLVHRRRHRGRAAHDGSGFASFLDFDRVDDPEAPSTVHNGTRFAYQQPPTNTAGGSLAMPDPGSVEMVNPVSSGTGSGAPSAQTASPSLSQTLGISNIRSARASARTARVSARTANAYGTAPGTGTDAYANQTNQGLLAFPRTDSNALLVSAAHSASGHPIAVFGPQVAYFAPEILMEEDIHGPGIDAEGAAFPGVNLYVELGHGPDYAWSATSSGQDIIDTFAVPLCDPSGAAPSKGSDYYSYQGQCLPMQTITQTESWTPNPADSTPAGSQTLSVQRTDLGLVIARATVGGRPVVYTRLRSTYMHELDSAEGFDLFNEPAAMRTPQDFMNAAYQIGYTFNWFYIDNQHIAYFNSGHNPIRAANVNPLFPTWGNFSWQGWNPSDFTSDQTPQSQHPQVVDQDYLTSWNNKQAPGYADGDTGEEFSSIYRSQLLDAGIKSYLDKGQKMSLADLVNVMGTAATQDLRGVQVLPYALKILGHPSDPQAAAAVDTLSAWVASGAHRIDPTGSGHYDHAQAVQIMDAWWPLLVSAEFGPSLGTNLLGQVENLFAINDEPGHGTSGEHLGSSFDVGFYGVVQKDLRAVQGLPVNQPLSRIYCGQGNLAACRAALESSLTAALAETPQQVYPADGVCKAGDQECSDSIRFRPLGAVTQSLMPWQNRPTFQQAVEIQGHMP